MLVTCPKCEQKFKVPDSALGTKGRKLKCSSCEHKWHQMPVGAEDGEPEAPPVAKKKKKAPPPEPVAEEPLEEAVGQDQMGEEIDPPPLGDVSRFRAVRGTEDEKPSRPYILYGLLFLAVAIPAGLFAARTSLVHAWPASALLYEKVGMPVPVPGEGLVLQNVYVERRQEGTVEVLVVHGEIRNPGELMMSLPALRATVIAEGGQTLASWLFTTESYQLLPGEKTAFVSEFANTAPGAAKVNVTFTDARPEAGLGY
ncbi:DUF3426 domain-containing protein [Thalassobaculum salexigens]|uniref:DUF3426 domain-containing protein n=1 Tax=Thalassobaculum salexigens TaxID=455360 RepID=UPI00248E582B|nr:DUF3426 domain-containing protein [Thalassobaculum salexigens]